MAKPLPLFGRPDSIEIIPARATVETVTATVIDLGKATGLRPYIACLGTVSTSASRLWFNLLGVWCRRLPTADGDPLADAEPLYLGNETTP